MQAWLTCHGRQKITPTDQWYLDFANGLMPVVSDSNLYKDCPVEEQQRISMLLTLYLEDCVADEGAWREFIQWHCEMYGRYLPFYSLTESYLPDEINLEDITFLLWSFDSGSEEEYTNIEDPFDEDLLELAQAAYSLMDEVFEEAPISEFLAHGWVMEPELMAKKQTSLPVIVPGEKLPVDVERFLVASKGEPLMYISSYAELRSFFVQSLGWEDKDDSLLPDLAESGEFVLYANPKGLLIAPDIASFFCDARNPLYNEEESIEEAYFLFCEKGCCPFDLLKYAMTYNLIPEAAFPFENGKELLRDNWDFIARWFLGNYFEGE